jgi:ABC-type polysaccharide/polyol phosphate transport system ATPase subunit
VDCRQRLQYNLSQIFPESAVLAVMAAHPKETDAQRLCQRIMAAQKGFSQQSGETEQQNQQYPYHEG